MGRRLKGLQSGVKGFGQVFNNSIVFVWFYYWRCSQYPFKRIREGCKRPRNKPVPHISRRPANLLCGTGTEYFVRIDRPTIVKNDAYKWNYTLV